MLNIVRAAVLAVAAIGAATSAVAQGANNNPVHIDTRAESAGKAAAISALTERARQGGRIRVIIGLNVELADESQLSAPQAEAQTRRLRSTQSAVSQRSSLSTVDVVQFNYVPYMSAFVTATQLQRLLSDPDVVSIQEDVPARPLLQDSVPLIRANRAWARGFSGHGYVVAVLDSGADDRHPMLRNKLVAALCRSTNSTTVNYTSTSLCPDGVEASNNLRSGRPCPGTIEGCDHGTHVTSIAVGKSGALRGVARDAGFIIGQVFSRFTGSICDPGPSPCILSFTTDQVSALERVFQLRVKFNIASINMSLGGGSFTAACDDQPQTSIIGRLYRAKIATVIASGNDGFDGSISSPACITDAVAVGSTTKSDVISSFSNHSDLVDVLAPGSSITAAGLNNQYVVKSGTSMATPHVAGAFAVLREAKPTASVNEILKALRQTGKSISRDGIAKRRIDVGAAADKLNPP